MVLGPLTLRAAAEAPTGRALVVDAARHAARRKRQRAQRPAEAAAHDRDSRVGGELSYTCGPLQEGAHASKTTLSGASADLRAFFARLANYQLASVM